MKTFTYTCKAAVLLCLTVGARTALADLGYAYTWITDGSAATVSASFSLNPGGGAVTATHVATGEYSLTFPNSGIGTGWVVLAAAVGGTADYCNALNWGSSALSVLCYNGSGAAADSQFTVLAVSNFNDKNIAFTWANQPTTASYTPSANSSFNPSGTIAVSRTRAGTYTVVFNGLNGNAGGTVQISATGSNATCYSGEWGGNNFTEIVNCAGPTGNPVDSQFVIAVIPPTVSPTGLAYSQNDDDTASSYTPSPAGTYNPTGSAVNIARASAGQYLVTFASLDAVQLAGGTVRVTSFGSAALCQPGVWGPSGGGSFAVSVFCFDNSGNPVDSYYTILVLPPMGYAYALIDGIPRDLQASSVNPGGQPLTSVHNGTGSYTVNFPNSGIGFGWLAQAIAYGTNASICKVSGWSGGGIDVLCFNSAGTAVDAPFTVLAVSSTNGSNIAFAYADLDTTASYVADTNYSYNPAGTIDVTRSGTGTYAVVFNGLNSNEGTVQVTAFGSDSATCYSNGWATSNFEASVHCETAGGAPVDSQFVVLVIPAGATPNGVGYALASQPVTPSYTANSDFTNSGTVNITRSSTGSYSLSFVGLNNTQFYGGYARVTPYGTSDRCKATGWSSNPNLTVGVSCFDTTGAFSDADFLVLLFTPIVGPPTYIGALDGSPQSTVVTTAFGTALSAAVGDKNSLAVSGVPVTFNAPGSGASGTFPGSSLTATTVTNSAGVATSPTFTANSTTGAYTVTASVLGVATPANFALTNTALTSVTLQTAPAGLMVSVDGETSVPAPLIVDLVPGSQHTIATQSPQAGAAGVQFGWLNWSDSLAISHTITVPATDTAYTATFNTQYQLTIAASPAGGGSATPASLTFYNAGTAVPIAATANAGFTFNAWSGPVASPSSASTTVTMSGPTAVTANFRVTNPCDVKMLGVTGIADVQAVVNQALGMAPAVNDLNQSGRVDVVDIQLVIDSMLGLGCEATAM